MATRDSIMPAHSHELGSPRQTLERFSKASELELCVRVPCGAPVTPRVWVCLWIAGSARSASAASVNPPSAPLPASPSSVPSRPFRSAACSFPKRVCSQALRRPDSLLCRGAKSQASQEARRRRPTPLRQPQPAQLPTFMPHLCGQSVQCAATVRHENVAIGRPKLVLGGGGLLQHLSSCTPQNFFFLRRLSAGSYGCGTRGVLLWEHPNNMTICRSEHSAHPGA